MRSSEEIELLSKLLRTVKRDPSKIIGIFRRFSVIPRSSSGDFRTKIYNPPSPLQIIFRDPSPRSTNLIASWGFAIPVASLLSSFPVRDFLAGVSDHL
jgi:hypothetical protein